MVGKRVSVYVDGFNLYYRALKDGPYKWLDIEAFTYQFLDSVQRIEKIRYFTARVSGAQDPDAPRRQQQYLDALGTIDCLEIKFGNFLTKRAKKPLVKPNGKPGKLVEVFHTEEKGSDVNLGAHLVNDAHLDAFDVAMVLSQDSDLLEPMRIVKAMKKPVGIIWLQPQTKVKKEDWTAPSRYHKDASTFIKFARTPHYRDAQFDDEIKNLDGTVAAKKPAEW
jgi:hypothetical protein